jgi:PAS domain S-box-containing protein
MSTEAIQLRSEEIAHRKAVSSADDRRSVDLNPPPLHFESKHAHADGGERRHAERAAVANERALQLIIDTIPVLAWSARADGAADFLNRHYQEYVGLPVDQLLGWGWTSAVHPEDRAQINRDWQAMLSTGRGGELEARFRRFDGQYRWLLVRTNPLRDEMGRLVAWYGINIDIEEQKRAQEELRRSQAFLAEGQRLSSTGSFSWHPHSDRLTGSDELYRIFGFDDKRAPLTLERVIERVHPEDAAILTEKLRLARSGIEDHDHDIRLQMPDGSVKYLRTVARAIEHPDGLLEYLGTIQDITERRVSADALEKVRSELAHVTRTMSLGVLTASIAHEVNQPLAGIITNADTCLRMLSADPPNVAGALATVRRTRRDGQRAAEVIAHLRALFCRKDIATEAVDLNEATREVIALFWQDLQRRRISLHSEMDEQLPAVSGDRVQLQQVILNLLSNASDSFDAIDDRPRQISICTRQDPDGAARLSVRDAGSGLLPELSDKLFDAFYTTKVEGMGIGLSVSRSIIESHQGQLWCEPNDGPGTTFTFAIPIRRAAEERACATDTSSSSDTIV